MLSSHHYKSFKVSMIHRLRFTTDVQLGISGDKVEIDPVTNQKASTKFWIKQKPISIDCDLLCACDLAEEKSPSHAVFKLTYLSSHDYKHLYFESDAATVSEIVLKVSSVHSDPRVGVWVSLGPGLHLPLPKQLSSPHRPSSSLLFSFMHHLFSPTTVRSPSRLRSQLRRQWF